MKNHITKLAWSGDDKFSLALLDQNFKPINKDLISSCYINMCVLPVTVQRLQSSLQLVYRIEKSNAKKNINFNILLQNNILLDGNATVAITGISIPKIYNVQSRYYWHYHPGKMLFCKSILKMIFFFAFDFSILYTSCRLD